ncbi:vesicular, overexpressed in cancer, prosurvival protein 1-like [Biomphalaria glabrata]|uniref:Vesicular, overexpressed in cancer, prosurvival protein 1-like n=1 Tax=Biomphalaria glabrata TaxID=6526 RepID=A0A9W3A9B6_BIOGL|nr:vesicular, overexpressed in cancer, prosurvival protein 1-like [Biomphalaria glabrata]
MRGIFIVIFLCMTLAKFNSAEYCYSSIQTSIYCYNDCCGTRYYQYCCTDTYDIGNSGIIVAIAVPLGVAFGAFIALIVCCCKGLLCFKSHAVRPGVAHGPSTVTTHVSQQGQQMSQPAAPPIFSTYSYASGQSQGYPLQAYSQQNTSFPGTVPQPSYASYPPPTFEQATNQQVKTQP